VLPNITPSDSGPDVPPVTTPDLAESGKLEGLGIRSSGIIGHAIATFWATLVDGLSKIITLLADAFDDIAALMTGFFTAAQGQDTPGFNRLVAAVLSDTLGVEVSAEQLQQAQFESGRVGAMNQVGADLFQTLGNEFLGVGATPDAGPGIAGLPGETGTPLTPEQGVKAAQSFIGFALSFAVRQGNVAFLSSALPWHWLEGIREYGEMMAKNLGLGRLVRRALQPYIQTLIASPLQEALNRQYRPHTMDAKQLASAFIRSDIDRSDYVHRLEGLGYKTGDIDLLIADTFTRLREHDVFLLEENGLISSSDAQARITALGFNTSDVPLIRQARELDAVQGADRQYAAILTDELLAGVMTQGDFDAAINALRVPKLEADALTRNAAARMQSRRKHLSLGFLKRAFIDGQITVDELMRHVLELGYSQDDADLIEVELLLQVSEHKTKAAAKAKAAATKAAGKTPPTPPTVP